VLILLVPLLIVLHIRGAQTFEIPLLQYSFVTMLVAFIFNYTAIIRKYELMPYLPVDAFDNKLKLLCLLSVGSILSSLYFGWNGSGGILFAIFWEQTRGSRMGILGVYFAIIIVGSLLMEKNYTLSASKAVEFIPGLLFGYINSEIYKLKSSNYYAVAHQFTFLCSVTLPIFFPACKMIVPSLMQWVVMIVCGFLMVFTVAATVRLMQAVRVSVVMGVLSGLLMVGTSVYSGTMDYVGLLLIGAGVVMLIKQEFYDIEC
jgi:hypothetical protein